MILPFLKEAITNLFSRPSTVEYPNKVKESPAKPRYRGRVTYDPEKCLDCGQCIKVCSPSSITRTEEDVPEGKKITLHFDMTSCTFCGTCEDFCDSKAIHLTEDYHLVDTDPAKLSTEGSHIKAVVKGRLKAGADCVFCGLCAKNCPNGAITVDRANKSWSVDEEKCVKCGICVSKCPKKCLAFETVEPEVKCVGDCVFCGLCAKKCPQEAITVDRAAKSWSVDNEKCVKCGICVNSCPKKALVLE